MKERGSIIRIERILGARLLLVQDDLINYETGGQHRYAYFKDKSMLPIMNDSIKKDTLVNLLIERLHVGTSKVKEADFLIEVKVSTTVKPTSTRN